MPFQLVYLELKKVAFLLVLMMLLLQSSAQTNPNVTLTWDPSSDPSVAGYKVYFGTTSHQYSLMATIGNKTTATIPGLTRGATYYFAITAYDNLGNESEFSTETAYLVPTITTTTLTSMALSGGQFGLAVAGVPGNQYIVQASTNLTDWVAVATNTAPFTFTDTNTTSFAQRFFRVANQSL